MWSDLGNPSRCLLVCNKMDDSKTQMQCSSGGLHSYSRRVILKNFIWQMYYLSVCCWWPCKIRIHEWSSVFKHKNSCVLFVAFCSNMLIYIYIYYLFFVLFVLCHELNSDFYIWNLLSCVFWTGGLQLCKPVIDVQDKLLVQSAVMWVQS